MKELVAYIAQSLVDHPELVKTEETEEDDSITVELTVVQDDLDGRVLMVAYMDREALGALRGAHGFEVAGLDSEVPLILRLGVPVVLLPPMMVLGARRMLAPADALEALPGAIEIGPEPPPERQLVIDVIR